jgi:hypothetical protein
MANNGASHAPLFAIIIAVWEPEKKNAPIQLTSWKLEMRK